MNPCRPSHRNVPIIYSDDQASKTNTGDLIFPGVQCVHFPSNDKNKEKYFAVFSLNLQLYKQDYVSLKLQASLETGETFY